MSHTVRHFKIDGEEPQIFAAMFNGRFKEGQEEVAVMKEIEGVVSVGSFKLLIEWQYRGTIVLPPKCLSVKQTITQILDFTRLCNMVDVEETGPAMAKYLKAIMVSSTETLFAFHHAGHDKQDHAAISCIFYNNPGVLTNCLSSEHIVSAPQLPQGHAVRNLFATAAVEGALRQKQPKFWEEMLTVPNFAVDVLLATRMALRNTSITRAPNGLLVTTFKDPFTGDRVQLM